MKNAIIVFFHAIKFSIALLSRQKEKEIETLLIPYILSEGDIAVDVGANGANWTYLLSKQVGKKGKIFAFEADPYYSRVTKETIKLLRLNNVILFPYGLGSGSKTVNLKVFSENNTRFSGEGYITDENNVANSSMSVSIQIKGLDSLVKNHPLISSASFIKCDTEGYELFVFQGAESLLKTSRPIIVLETGHSNRYGYTNKDLYDFFKSFEYVAFIMGDDMMLTEADEDLSPTYVRRNRVLIPLEKLDLVTKLKNQHF